MIKAGSSLSKHEVALLLREHGFTYKDIIRELYPEEFKRYLETRDYRLYKRLKKRVWRLIKYAESKFTTDRAVDPAPLWTPGYPKIDDSGGERDPLSHRFVERLSGPRTRKAGLRGAERQKVEYEQLLYYYYNRFLRRYDGEGKVLWGTVRLLHSRVFDDYYNLFRKNVWGVRRAGPVARAYAYAVLSAAVLLHGRPGLREELAVIVSDERAREWLEKVAPLVVPLIL